jgi:hypothetical protein
MIICEFCNALVLFWSSFGGGSSKSHIGWGLEGARPPGISDVAGGWWGKVIRDDYPP